MKSDWASYYNNFLTPKTVKMHKPIPVTLLKLQPKHSQFCCNPKKNSPPPPTPSPPESLPLSQGEATSSKVLRDKKEEVSCDKNCCSQK